MRRPPSRPNASTHIAVGVILFCVLLIGIGLYLNSRPGKPDWAHGPITPGAPPAQPTAPAPAPSLPPSAPAPANVQMLLGNPSDATPNLSNRDNYLMLKPYYTLSYNNSKGTPNWVSWRVQQSDLGTAPRKQTFDPDDTLPDAFYHVTHHDYTSSGFDRGHMCPHNDRAATIEMSYSTFVMTNIVPQAPNNNRKAWAQLENYSRELVRSGDRLYITAGPCGRGGVGSKGPDETIAGGRVTVPSETWKVIVVTHDIGRDDLANISAGDRVIAVDVPNDNDKVGEEWAGFRCSPASIEAKTGLHFFTALPAETRAAFDQKVDTESIASPRPMAHSGG